VKEVFYQLNQLDVTLLHSADDFFRSKDNNNPPEHPPTAVDGKRPVLMILRHRNE